MERLKEIKDMVKKWMQKQGIALEEE